MATTFTAPFPPDQSNGSVFYRFDGGIQTSDVFVFTLSDGRQFAITGYDDFEANDLMVGIPADDTINFYLWGANNGATFSVYAYNGGTLGALIHSYTNNGGSMSACFQFLYDTGTQQLSMTIDANGSWINSSTGDYASYSGTTVFSGAPVCFLRGTRILTDRGEVAVEALRPGDLVATRTGGLRPISWIGTQSYVGRLAGPSHQPIRFCAGSLGTDSEGGGLPTRDLLVSPGHAVLVGELLVHAGALVNDVTILREAIAGAIDYFHLDLGPHDCVRAEGAWAESYFEDRNRDRFHNAASFPTAGQAPVRQATCLPIVTAADPRLPALHALLAPKLASTALTADADLHLLADGRRIALRRIGDGTWQAALPAGIRSLRLCGNTVRPSMVGDSPDRRALGLMLHGLIIETTLGPSRVALDHPGLAQGWHPPEPRDGGLSRWTDGDAVIPAHLLGEGPSRLTLLGWHPPQFRAPEALALAA